MNCTLVLIPGLLSDKRVWTALANTASCQVHHAHTTLDDTIEAMAARLLSETKGTLVVVGHSMGARVAMEVARQSPDRVAGLVFSNTGHHPLQPGELEKRETKIAQGHTDFRGMVDKWLPPMVAASRHQDSNLMRDLTDMALAMGADVHERQIRALIARPNASAYLPEVACPLLLLTGTEDIWSPEPQHREIAQLVPNATLHIVEHAGHFLPVEQPEHCTALIMDWMAAHFDI